MTPLQRTKELRRLLKLCPGKTLMNKYAYIALVTCSKHQTVRCWMMAEPARFVPEIKLRALAASLNV